MKSYIHLFALLATAALAQAAAPKNVVLIFCDDLGYADIGPFGAKKYRTPHLDRMAGEGMKLTNFHVSSAVCSASRAALLTGCYHSRVGIHGALWPKSNTGLNPSETTLAEVCKSKGMATGMVGKWHLGSRAPLLPMAQGFDEWLGVPYSHDMWSFHPEAPKAYGPLPLYDRGQIVDDQITPDEATQLTTRFTERAVDFIGRNAAQPFFLYVAHPLPHVPLFVSDKFKGKSGAGLYGDVLQEIDWSVGEILGALTKHGIERETLVIFTSDNGPWLSYGEHAGSATPLREGKGTSWDGGTRVPFLAWQLGTIPPGKTSDALSATFDLLPTIARQIGAELPTRKLDGRDLWPLLTGQPGAQTPHEFIATYYADNELQAVRSQEWKLVFPHKYRTLGDQPPAKDGVPVKYRTVSIDAPQLYRTADDLAEARDVAASHPDEVKKLSAFAEKIRAELGDTLTRQPGSEVRPVGRVSEE